MKCIALAALCVLLLSRPAFADSQAAQLFAEGQTLYVSGDYVGAADKFVAAYELEADPAYIYNAAQAYRTGNACARAADAYRKFASAVPDPPEPEKLRSLIVEMDECAARSRTGASVDPPRHPPAQDDSASDRQAARADVADASPANPPTDGGVERDRARPRAKRTIAAIAGGVGLLSLGTAIWFTWDARFLARRHDELCADASAAAPCDGARLADYDRRGRRAERIAVTGYIAAGIGLAGGLALYALERQADEPTLSIGPTRDGGMITKIWRF
jgi:hypothetical protein